MDIRPSLIDTRVEAFEASGENRYRPITGWFQRTASEVWDFVFSTGDTIGSTPNHPFYSEKRQNYAPVGELEIGESVRLAAGKTGFLVSKKARANGLELVCNLEVWRDHNYYVGGKGVLVHNSCLDWLKVHNYAPPENSNTALGHIFNGHAFGSASLNKSKFVHALSSTQDDLKKFLNDFQTQGKIVFQDLETKGNGIQRPRFWYDVSEMMNKGDYSGVIHAGLTDKGVPTNIIRLVLDNPTSFSPYTCFPVDAAGK